MLDPHANATAVLRRIRPARADALAATWSAAIRVVVVGRTGVGKSTLINHWSGAAQATGLGGVTRETREIPVNDWVFIDTPGIDNADRALSTLGPVVDGADALVWVVDGLQPATHTARMVLEQLAEPGQGLAIVISRLDLVPPEEHQAVLKRLRVHAPQHTPIAGGDLRTWTAPPPDVLLRASPRRLRLAQQMYSDLQTKLTSSPPPGQAGWQKRVTERWHSQLQGATDHVLGLLDRGAVSGESAALVWLSDTHRRLSSAVASVVPPAMPPPNIPVLRLDAASAMDRVAAAMAGPDRTRRRIRQAAGAWMLEGDMAIADWAHDHPQLGAGAQQYETDCATLRATLAAF